MAQAGNVFYDSPRDIPAVIPIFPLEEALLLPRTQMRLNTFEEGYLTMIDHAMRNDRITGIIRPQEMVGRRGGEGGCGRGGEG